MDIEIHKIRLAAAHRRTARKGGLSCSETAPVFAGGGARNRDAPGEEEDDEASDEEDEYEATSGEDLVAALISCPLDSDMLDGISGCQLLTRFQHADLMLISAAATDLILDSRVPRFQHADMLSSCPIPFITPPKVEGRMTVLGDGYV